MLSSYLVYPQVEHIYQALNLFKYLKDHKRSKSLFNPIYVDINDNHPPYKDRIAVKAKYMSELYPDTVEEKLMNVPKARGRKF